MKNRESKNRIFWGSVDFPNNTNLPRNRKKNKTFFLFVPIIIFGLLILSLSACKKDKSCPNGWEGDNCNVSVKSEILGWYNAVDRNDNAQYDSYQYLAGIMDSVDAKIKISFFGSSIGGPDDFAVANITFEENTISFVIPSQIFTDDLRIKGSGKYNRTTKELTINYTYTDLNSNATAQFTGFWKKR